MSTDRYVIVRDDGTIILHEENDGCAFLRHGPQATERPITLEELLRTYPTQLQPALDQLAQRLIDIIATALTGHHFR
jgi:hypothetical protein